MTAIADAGTARTSAPIGRLRAAIEAIERNLPSLQTRVRRSRRDGVVQGLLRQLPQKDMPFDTRRHDRSSPQNPIWPVEEAGCSLSTQIYEATYQIWFLELAAEADVRMASRITALFRDLNKRKYARSDA
ncbi:MAG: hypothetical protein KAY22_08820 [Rhizorhabdus sp.]|uniref:hypothetical protein n=1 Tax=Rhizorhabdus sp. TaxID=1968843 RepID=UPI001B6ED6EF|nr:hypothetical protein [Rhizorhabdus sp.]MBP8232393.1 hypothetical protein [Rhizorhabdus sp.]